MWILIYTNSAKRAISNYLGVRGKTILVKCVCVCVCVAYVIVIALTLQPVIATKLCDRISQNIAH